MASAPNTAPDGATPQDAFDFLDVNKTTARFFDALPAGWTPIE